VEQLIGGTLAPVLLGTEPEDASDEDETATKTTRTRRRDPYVVACGTTLLR
jgi:hypothetical protein